MKEFFRKYYPLFPPLIMLGYAFWYLREYFLLWYPKILEELPNRGEYFHYFWNGDYSYLNAFGATLLQYALISFILFVTTWGIIKKFEKPLPLLLLLNALVSIHIVGFIGNEVGKVRWLDQYIWVENTLTKSTEQLIYINNNCNEECTTCFEKIPSYIK